MRTVSWKIKDGRTATVKISIYKRRRMIKDGWGNETPTEDPANNWSILYSAKVEGVGEVNGCNRPISDDCPAGYAGQLGKLGFKADTREQIESAIAEVEASDDWKRHLAAEAEAEKGEEEYWEHRNKIEKAMEE